MKLSTGVVAAALASAVFLAGCGKDESAADQAIEDTRDTLGLREYEKLKDAAEDARLALALMVISVPSNIASPSRTFIQTQPASM